MICKRRRSWAVIVASAFAAVLQAATAGCTRHPYVAIPIPVDARPTDGDTAAQDESPIDAPAGLDGSAQDESIGETSADQSFPSPGVDGAQDAGEPRQ
jgi:hypothetical protein